MQFCYFFCKNRHFFGYKCVSIQNSTWIGYFALSCCTAHSATQLTVTDVLQRAAMLQLSAKVLKLSFEYLHIYSPKSSDFYGEKHQHCIVNVLSKLDLRTENIEMPPQPRFRGYSMNTLNIYRRRPCRLRDLVASSDSSFKLLWICYIASIEL